MRLAIYDRKGSYSDRWIQACQDRNIPYITVDLFDDALIETLRRDKITAVLAHPPMADRRSRIAAHAIIQSLAVSDLCDVFPRPSDFWHFDDKVAQQYAFDACAIPTPKTHVFFERHQAVKWAENATFPWVFKLKAGAGSVNVTLVRTRDKAKKKIEKMFAQGYTAHAGATKDIANKLRTHKRKGDWAATVKRVPKTLQNYRRKRKEFAKERGYVYFQEFVPDNDCDVRVIVVGDRAWALKRGVRPGDFRASGSGLLERDPRAISEQCIALAFDAARKLKMSCVAFDIIEDKKKSKYLIVEMSYGVGHPIDQYKCPGHWRPNMSWRDGQMWLQDAILDDMIERVGSA